MPLDIFKSAAEPLAPQPDVDLSIRLFSLYKGVLHVEAVVAAKAAEVWLELSGADHKLSTTPQGDHTAFHGSIATERAEDILNAAIKLVFENGNMLTIGNLPAKIRAGDPYHQLLTRFTEALQKMQGGMLVEIGSRNRSGNVRKNLCPEGMHYVGFDIAEGENVDVVGDAHTLSTHFAPESVDAILTISTFEHLLMPWKVALEINKTLKTGGLICIQTHQTWPTHEAPWDFWRFSQYAWKALFNQHTGFEIVATAMGMPATVLPHYSLAATLHMPEHEGAFLGSAMLARKIAPTSLAWDVATTSITNDEYPL